MALIPSGKLGITYKDAVKKYGKADADLLQQYNKLKLETVTQKAATPTPGVYSKYEEAEAPSSTTQAGGTTPSKKKSSRHRTTAGTPAAQTYTATYTNPDTGKSVTVQQTATQAQAQARAEVGLPNMQPPAPFRSATVKVYESGQITRKEAVRQLNREAAEHVARRSSIPSAFADRPNSLGSAGQFSGESIEWSAGDDIFFKMNRGWSPTGTEIMTERGGMTLTGESQAEELFRKLSPGYNIGEPKKWGMTKGPTKTRVTASDAYSMGLISKRDYERDKSATWSIPMGSYGAAGAAKASIKKEYGAAGLQYGEGLTIFDRMDALVGMKEKAVETLARNPIVQLSYHTEPFNIIGTGFETVMAAITGKPNRAKEGMRQYAGSLFESSGTEAGRNKFIRERMITSGAQAGVIGISAGGAAAASPLLSLVSKGTLYGIGTQAVAESARELYTSDDKVTAAIRLAAIGGGALVGGKAAAKFPIKLRNEPLPLGQRYRGISAEWGAGAQAQPLLGFVNRKPTLGTPQIDLLAKIEQATGGRNAVYHGTPIENVLSIQKKGLKGSKEYFADWNQLGGEKAVFFTNQKAIAKAFADKTGGIFEIQLTPAQKARAIDLTGGGKVPMAGKALLTDVISPEQIKLISLKEAYMPKSATATKITKSNILKAYGIEAPKFTSIVDVLEVIGNTKSRFNKGKFPKETKTLSPAGTKATLDFLMKQKELEVVYGSFTAEPQLKGGLGRLSGDIDAQMRTIEEKVAAMAREHLETLKKTEGAERVRISPKSPSLIQTLEKGKTPRTALKSDWHNALDLHALGEASSSLNKVMEGALGFKYGGRKVKIEGLPAMDVSEFVVRKGSSSATLREMGIGPAEHRIFKDTMDFATGGESQIASESMGLYGKVRPGRIAKAEKGMETFKKAWGLDKMKISKPTTVKVELYRPPSPSKGNAQLLRSMGIIPSAGASMKASSSATLRSMGISPSPSSRSASPSAMLRSMGISPSPSPRSPSTSASLLRSYGIYSPSPSTPSRSVSPSGRASPSPISRSVSPSPYASPPSASASRKLYPMMFGGASMAAKAKPGYDAYVKVRVNPRTGRGKAKKINKEPLGFYGAVSAGASYVDNTPAGSFTVRKAKKAAKEQGIDIWHGGLDRKFRARKLKTTFTAAEKTPFLMDTTGERKFYKGTSKEGKKRANLRRRGIDIRSAL